MRAVLFLQTSPPAVSSSTVSIGKNNKCNTLTPTLFTCLTTASRTSPLKGRKTIALYLTGYTTKPCPGKINPAPMLSILVTAMTNPYLRKVLTSPNYKLNLSFDLLLSGASTFDFSIKFRFYLL